MLYVLQQRDRRGGKVDPTVVRALALAFEGIDRLVGRTFDELLALFDDRGRSLNARAHVKEIIRWTTVGFERMTGTEPTDKLVWDLLSMDLRAKTGSRRVRIAPGQADFTRISQPWLQSLAMAVCRTHKTSSDVLDTLRGAEVASRALACTPGGGRDATRLGAKDMDTIIEGFRNWRDDNGSLYSYGSRKSALASLTSLFEYGRRAGLMQDIPNGFNRDRDHRLPREEAADDEGGRALPESVIAQLDQALDTLDCAVEYPYMTGDEQKHMMRTAYIVMRDTGRRPREVCSLTINCLDEDDGAVLIWDNRKSRRLKRRLPITRQTATYIAEWQAIRLTLEPPEMSRGYLFPARTAESVDPYIAPYQFAQSIRDWADQIPVLHSPIPTAHGTPAPFDRKLVYPYAFRHSYAQRHADAGTPIDVLRDLMDHKQISATQVYWLFMIEGVERSAAVGL